MTDVVAAVAYCLFAFVAWLSFFLVMDKLIGEERLFLYSTRFVLSYLVGSV